VFGHDHEGASKSGYCHFRCREERDAFFRILALYHDIGKAVIKERHPMVGWHLINDVYRKEVREELFPLVLGREADEWRADLKKSGDSLIQITDDEEKRLLTIFERAIRFHDYFGVLSTGEGSLPLILDVIPLRATEPQETQAIFSVLMLLNLADIYGSVDTMLPEKVEVFHKDWKFLCDTIYDVHGDRALFFDAVRRRTQTTDSTIERLRRLMCEEAPTKWRDQIPKEMVEDILKEATLSRMYPFVRNFALFCKLDYCLPYKKMLMNITKTRSDLRSPQVPVDVMIRLLAEIEKRYGDLCRRPDRTWRRIGVEMAGLTRRPSADKKPSGTSKIGEAIADLLLQPGGLGKEWAVSECTVWFMEE